MQEIFDAVLDCDLLVLATPIYSWCCTSPMEAVLDRLVYGMNKYYGEEKGPALWAGKQGALLTTCGYPPERGADLWGAGVIRYCKHSRLNDLGMLAERDLGYTRVFMNKEKAKHARTLAEFILKYLKSFSISVRLQKRKTAAGQTDCPCPKTISGGKKTAHALASKACAGLKGHLAKESASPLGKPREKRFFYLWRAAVERRSAY